MPGENLQVSKIMFSLVTPALVLSNSAEIKCQVDK